MYSCWFRAVVGIAPNKSECKQLHPNGCSDCSYYMPDPPEPEDKSEQDDMPSV